MQLQRASVATLISACLSAVACLGGEHPANRDRPAGEGALTAECERKPAAPYDSGGTLTLNQSSNFRCALVVEPTAVELRPDSLHRSPVPIPVVFIRIA